MDEEHEKYMKIAKVCSIGTEITGIVMYQELETISDQVSVEF